MNASPRTIRIEVLRYRPEKESEPVVQAFDVPFSDDMSVLQGLQYIKDELDGSLSYRWSCRMAICGSCGMMINGVPKLACSTFLRDLYPGPLRVEPLAVPGGFICWASWMRRLSCPVVGRLRDSRRMRVMTLKMISTPSAFFAEVAMKGA